jgi:hypothetical protein
MTRFSHSDYTVSLQISCTNENKSTLKAHYDLRWLKQFMPDYETYSYNLYYSHIWINILKQFSVLELHEETRSRAKQGFIPLALGWETYILTIELLLKCVWYLVPMFLLILNWSFSIFIFFFLQFYSLITF